MARLTAADVIRLQQIGAMTRTIVGPETPEPCWSWALYGGGTPKDPVDLFAIVNAENVANALGSGPVERKQLFDTAVRESRLPGRLSFAERRWAKRQYTKFQGGGKYSIDYMFEKLVKRAIDRAGLKVATTAGNYYVCMHAPTVHDITYEHWWLEVHGYTIEKITRWHMPFIYQRGAEQDNYRAVRIPITGLHQRQVDRIVHILDHGQNYATQVWS